MNWEKNTRKESSSSKLHLANLRSIRIYLTIMDTISPKLTNAMLWIIIFQIMSRAAFIKVSWILKDFLLDNFVPILFTMAFLPPLIVVIWICQVCLIYIKYKNVNPTSIGSWQKTISMIVAYFIYYQTTHFMQMILTGVNLYKNFNEDTEQTLSSRLNDYPIIAKLIFYEFFGVVSIFSLIIPRYFAAKLDFSNMMNNYEPKYEISFNVILILRIALVILIDDKESLDLIELCLSLVAFINYIVYRPYINFNTRKMLIWAITLDGSLKLLSLLSSRLKLQKNLVLFLGLISLSYSSKLSNILVVRISKIDFLNPKNTSENNAKGLTFYAQYFNKRFHFEKDMSGINDLFKKAGVILEDKFSIDNISMRPEGLEDMINYLLNELRSTGQSNEDFSHPELDLYYSGLFKNHFEECKDIKCYCRRLKGLEETEKLLLNAQFKLLKDRKMNRKEYDNRLFNAYRKILKRRLLIFSNIELIKSGYSDSIIYRLSGIFSLDIYEDLKPICYIFTRIERCCKAEGRRENFKEYFFQQTIRMHFTKICLDEEGLRFSEEIKKAYVKSDYIDLERVMLSNNLEKAIFSSLLDNTLDLMRLFRYIYGASENNLHYIHHMTAKILLKEIDIDRYTNELLCNTTYGQYIFPFIAIYFIRSRGDFLKGDAYFKLFKRRTILRLRARSRVALRLGDLSLVGTVLTVSLNYRNFTSIVNITKGAEKLFHCNNAEEYLIGNSIEHILPEEFRRTHKVLISSLRNINTMINRNRLFWIEGEDGLIKAITFMMKFNPSVRNGIEVLVAIKEVRYDDKLCLLVGEDAEIMNFSYNWVSIIPRNYLKTKSLKFYCFSLFNRLFLDEKKVKDNIFILQRKMTQLEKNSAQKDKKMTFRQYTLHQATKLFTKGFVGDEDMVKRVEDIVHFDDSRGDIGIGLLFPLIHISDKQYSFTFKGKGMSYILEFIVSYRKDSYMGKIFYFIELTIKNKAISLEKITKLDNNEECQKTHVQWSVNSSEHSTPNPSFPPIAANQIRGSSKDEEEAMNRRLQINTSFFKAIYNVGSKMSYTMTWAEREKFESLVRKRKKILQKNNIFIEVLDFTLGSFEGQESIQSDENSPNNNISGHDVINSLLYSTYRGSSTNNIIDPSNYSIIPHEESFDEYDREDQMITKSEQKLYSKTRSDISGQSNSNNTNKIAKRSGSSNSKYLGGDLNYLQSHEEKKRLSMFNQYKPPPINYQDNSKTRVKNLQNVKIDLLSNKKLAKHVTADILRLGKDEIIEEEVSEEVSSFSSSDEDDRVNKNDHSSFIGGSSSYCSTLKSVFDIPKSKIAEEDEEVANTPISKIQYAEQSIRKLSNENSSLESIGMDEHVAYANVASKIEFPTELPQTSNNNSDNENIPQLDIKQGKLIDTASLIKKVRRKTLKALRFKQACLDSRMESDLILKIERKKASRDNVKRHLIESHKKIKADSRFNAGDHLHSAIDLDHLSDISDDKELQVIDGVTSRNQVLKTIANNKRYFKQIEAFLKRPSKFTSLDFFRKIGITLTLIVLVLLFVNSSLRDEINTQLVTTLEYNRVINRFVSIGSRSASIVYLMNELALENFQLGDFTNIGLQNQEIYKDSIFDKLLLNPLIDNIQEIKNLFEQLLTENVIWSRRTSKIDVRDLNTYSQNSLFPDAIAKYGSIENNFLAFVVRIDYGVKSNFETYTTKKFLEWFEGEPSFNFLLRPIMLQANNLENIESLSETVLHNQIYKFTIYLKFVISFLCFVYFIVTLFKEIFVGKDIYSAYSHLYQADILYHYLSMDASCESLLKYHADPDHLMGIYIRHFTRWEKEHIYKEREQNRILTNATRKLSPLDIPKEFNTVEEIEQYLKINEDLNEIRLKKKKSIFLMNMGFIIAILLISLAYILIAFITYRWNVTELNREISSKIKIIDPISRLMSKIDTTTLSALLIVMNLGDKNIIGSVRTAKDFLKEEVSLSIGDYHSMTDNLDMLFTTFTSGRYFFKENLCTNAELSSLYLMNRVFI